MKNKCCKGCHVGTEGDVVIYDKPGCTGVLHSGQTRSKSGGQRCCALLSVLEERSAVLSIKTGHHPARVFVKSPSLGVLERVRHTGLCSYVRALAHGTARSLVTAYGAGLWSQYDRTVDLKPSCRTSCRAQTQARTTNTSEMLVCILPN